MADRLLVLAVDIDNDLYTKTKIAGPVIGRKKNIYAAEKLALADPLDPDSNVIFQSVKKYDELKKAGNSVIIATITGAEKEGYAADSELSRQIDIILDKFKIDACVLVTDGASDNRVLPILKSRINVNSVELVRMKQAETLENTYFVIFEKLKEPHYARIFFGIPAILLLLFALGSYFNYGWKLPVILVGLYLLIKGFGLEEFFVRSFKGLGFSHDRVSFILYISSLLFFLINIILGYQSYITGLQSTSGLLYLSAYFIEGFIILLPITLLLYLIGRMIDLENQRLRYRAITLGSNVGYSVIIVVMLYLSSAWILAQIYFSQFLLYGFIIILFGYGISKLTFLLRRRAVRKAKMKNKKVINDLGAYIGEIIGIDSNRGIISVKTDYGTLVKYDVDRIVNISDRVMIK